MTRFALLAMLLAGSLAHAQAPVGLITPTTPAVGWKFDNGQEFKGATGSLTADTHEGRPSLKLHGDFTRGGRYVQAGRSIDRVDIRDLTMWVRNPDADRFTLRLIDGGGQVHQLSIRTEPGADWQKVTLPLETFFANRGQADAVTTVTRYESWGGARDGKWHGPATGLYILVSPTEKTKTRTIWLGDITITPRPTEVPGVTLPVQVRLDEILEGEHDWRFSNGPEFKGARGALTVVQEGERTALKLTGDFTSGGAYCAAIKDLKALDAKDATAIRLRYRSTNATAISVQLVDSTGQTHQRKGVKLTADGQWHDLVLKPTGVVGSEHWGGANDAKWHGPPTRFSISLTAGSDAKGKQPTLEFTDVVADVLRPVFAQLPAFRSYFESPLQGWTVTGNVRIDAGSLLLTRSENETEKPCSAAGPTFPVVPGRWQIGLSSLANLRSPDNSYNAVVSLEGRDAAGKVMERFTLADVFGKHPWTSASKILELPKGIASARFQVQLNKTSGEFRIDNLTAAYLAPAPRRDDRIIRLLFASPRTGNLLFPDDPRTLDLTVETRKPLRHSQHTVECVVRDYWGAEQAKPIAVTLNRPEKKGDRYVYTGRLDLANVPLELHRYYEVHAAIPQEGEEPFRHQTSLAILPEAEAKKFKADEVPFTARNWDNRIPAFIELSDRLGIRICGLWGSWSAKPPYKAEAPGLEQVKKLGMGWLTTTPIKLIEKGNTEYDEKALRQGVRNLIEAYGQHRPFIINLGNEPHGTGERVLKNVEAYRVVYDEVKKVDPSIPVVATSVEPNEEYFKAGYGKYCDAYDFHIYENAENVRRTIGQYRELMKKYGVEKPIWSTELGLNSQGQTRHVVANKLVKKFATFFAAGGANMSWFCFLYPDPEGKSHGSSGDTHNVFDSRFNRYAPRLDAVAYYHMVNAIAIKKFVTEIHHDNGIRAFLFRDRDNRTLQVLWAEKGRQDVAIPLPDVQEVDAIHIDGTHRTLTAHGKGITLGITTDPVLLLYTGGPGALPATLEPAAIRLESAPRTLSRTEPSTITVSAKGISTDAITLQAPPFWDVQKTTADAKVSFRVTPPAGTAVREGEFTVILHAGDKVVGELPLRIPVAESSVP